MKQQMQRRTDANSVSAKSHQNRKLIVPDVGRKLVFDNIDYRHEVHYMTEEHQSVDNHCVTVMAVENRVSGSHLSDQQPEGGILQLENGKCIPSSRDNAKQRDNYIVLVGRVIATNIKCLRFLSDVTIPHIPHSYRKEMITKSEIVSISIVIVLIMITNKHNINQLSPKVPSFIISLSLRQTILLVNEDSCA